MGCVAHGLVLAVRVVVVVVGASSGSGPGAPRVSGTGVIGPSALFNLGVRAATGALGLVAVTTAAGLVLAPRNEFSVESEGDPEARGDEEGVAEDVADAEFLSFLFALEFCLPL